jgi:hypothetical protein
LLLFHLSLRRGSLGAAHTVRWHQFCETAIVTGLVKAGYAPRPNTVVPNGVFPSGVPAAQ